MLTYKNPEKKPTPIDYVFEGYGAGIAFVVIGIVIIRKFITNTGIRFIISYLRASNSIGIRIRRGHSNI